MGKFVQIVEYTTTRFDEVKKIGEEFRDQVAAHGGAKPLTVMITKNRDVPNRYASVVLFASYEEAMENSNRPETGQFAARMMELCDGPPTFHNLEVVEEFAP